MFKPRQYYAPQWSAGLSIVPRSRLALAVTPTPLYRWRAPVIDDSVELWIKRDDLTGSTLSGNKVRKLEFLLYEALKQGSDTIITCGGLQSNHARATAVAARQLGMHSHIFLGTNDPDTDPGWNGNLMLDRLAGAAIHLIPPDIYEDRERVMNDLAADLVRAGKKPYVIPEGGSNALGSWGYIDAWREIIENDAGEIPDFDDIVFACGSGGTPAGLALAVRMSGKQTRVHAVNVSDHPDTFHMRINRILDDLGTEERSEKLVDLVDGYSGRGYALSRPEELRLLRDVAGTTGVILDPVYTIKAFYGLCEEFRKNRDRFAGRRILFLHTGGLFGVYAKLNELVETVDDYQ